MLKQRWVCATAITSSLALMSVPALAQTQTSGVTKPCSPGASLNCDRVGDEDVDPRAGDNRGESDVVVTGTRIRSTSLDSPYAVTTVGGRYLEDRNFTNVADAINTIPGIRGSVTPGGAQGSFGQGVNFVNIGGIGSNRTLTLINGKRYVTSNPNTLFNQGSAGTQVDSNVVQSILLSDIEITSINGAVAYGSDAIGGVVNYILRDRYKGFTAQGLAGVSQEGDGFRYSGALLAGHDYLDGRLNVTVAYTHDEQRGIVASKRDFLRAGVGTVTNPTSAQAAGALGRTPASGITAANDGRLNPNLGYNNSTSDGNPGSVLVRDRTLYQITTGGIIAADNGRLGAFNYQFSPDGTLTPFNKGIIFAAPYASGGDGYRLYPFNQLTSQLVRDTANVFLHYDATDDLTLYLEGSFFRSKGDQLITQPTYNGVLFGGLSGALTFSSTNPFLSAQARSVLAANGTSRFTLSRASIDLADTSGGSDTNIGRVVAGLKGKFQLGDREFQYEAFGNYGRTRLVDQRQDLNAQRFINAVNVTTNGTGQIVCDPNPAFQAAPGGRPVADPACVPINLFGTGAPTAAAQAYVIENTRTVSILEQKDFVAYVSGSPFALFGNDFGVSLGYEHREEKGSFTPNSFQQQGRGRSVAILPTRGKYNLDEIYGEGLLRLVSPDNNIPLVDTLHLTGGFRYVDNTVNGGFLAWTAGGIYRPFKDLTLRGDFVKSFRSPALTELFLPQSNSFSFVDDLCAPGSRNGGPAPATRAANCAAFLARYPNATPLDAAAANVPSVSGGNPNLENEVANSYSFGGTFEPHWIPRLSISIDYSNIKIRNPISSLTVAQIVSACFDNPNFNTADPANGNAFCSQIQRYNTGEGGTAANGGDRGGQVVSNPTNPGVRSGFVNGQRVEYSQIAGKLDYRVPLNAIGIAGRFETSNQAVYVERRLVDNTGVAAIRTDGTYPIADPKIQVVSVNRIVIPEVGGILAQVNFFGKTKNTRAELSTDLREINRLPSYTTVDGSVWFDVDKKYRLTLSVTNIGNRRFFDYYGYALPQQYIDQIGRRFAVSARAVF